MVERIKAIVPTVLLVIFLMAASIITTYYMVTVGMLIGPIVIIACSGVLLMGWMVRDYKMGIYFMFLLSVFMSYVNRMLGAQIQFGIVLDAIAGLTFFIMLFTDREKRSWSGIGGPITYLYTAIVVYQLLQVFNPAATSFIGWVVAFRANTSFLLFFVCYQLFLNFEELKKFTVLWLALASIVAFYGIWQELFGLNAKELAWVYSNPGRVDLLLIWGHMRKFSLLSDPSIFGLFMSFSALACFVFVINPVQPIYRLLCAFLGTMMLISMSFSGTRTAIAMFVAGVAFYIVLTLRSRRTIIVMFVAIIGVIGILFGPFHGGTVNRIRSTFNASEDVSMGVRDRKRIRLQEYVISHPFGGGLNTTGMNGVKYSPGHPLAEGWDPDSGYLLTALELGWIGLIIGLAFFFVVVLKGIQNHFSLKDPIVKTYNQVYIVPFLAQSVAHFTQDAMFQKPVYLVIIATYAIMLTIPTYEKRTLNNP